MENIKTKLRFTIFMVAAMLLLSGCASRSLYSEAGAQFSKGYETAGKVVTDSLISAVRDTRQLAAVYYIQNGNSDLNLDSNEKDQSFRRYVCAGAGLYANEFKALGVLGSYRKIIADLSDEPSEEISELWASINELRKPKKPLEFEEAAPDAFDACVSSLEAPMVPPKGNTIQEFSKEGGVASFAAYDSFKTLVGSVKIALQQGLRIADEVARAKAVKQFVHDNTETVARLIGSINEDGTHNEGVIKDETLGKALEIRRRSALVKPYYEFGSIFKFSRNSEAEKIVNQSVLVHESLDEFDKLRLYPNPSNVLKAMRENQAELIRLANGDLTVSEAWGVFTAFADALSELEDAIGGVSEASAAL